MGPVEHFAKAMRREREARGYPQEAFADVCGLHRTEVSRLERATNDPKLTTMARVARGLGVPLAKLVADVE